MERPNFFNTQHVFSDDLNNIHDTLASQSIYRTQASLGDSGGIGSAYTFWTGSVAKGGICGSAKDYANTGINLCVSAPSANNIHIAPGEAIDINGNLIRVTSEISINFQTNSNTYNWPGGSIDSLNYVKIRYQEISGSIEADDFGVSHPTRYIGSYFVQIDNVVPNNNEILLATFLSDNIGIITSGSLQDRRTYVRTFTTADSVSIDPTIKPFNTCETIEDHVLALGTGTPSPTNPHGLTVQDLGYADEAITHRREAHNAGIVDFTGLYSGSLILGSYSGSVLSPTSNAYIHFQNPGPNCGFVVNGVVYTGSLPDLYGRDLYNISGNATYSVYATSNGAVSGTIQDISWDNTKLLLMKVTVDDDGDDLKNPIDMRSFYLMEPRLIEADFKESQISPVNIPSSSLPRYSTLETSLARIRGQIQNILQPNDGTTCSWTGSVETTLQAVRKTIGQIVTGSVNHWNGSVPVYGSINTNYPENERLIGASGSVKGLWNQFSNPKWYNLPYRSLNTKFQNDSGRTKWVSITFLTDVTVGADDFRFVLYKTNQGEGWIVQSDIGAPNKKFIFNSFVPPEWWYEMYVSCGTNLIFLMQWVEFD